MITLYVKTGCPFCAKVLAVLDAYAISFEEKNVSDPEVEAELIKLGGKKQMPFMVDGETMMYESESIIHHLEQHYRKTEGENKKPKIHFAKGTDLCPS